MFNIENARNVADAMKKEGKQANLKLLLAKWLGTNAVPSSAELMRAWGALENTNKKALYDLATDVNASVGRSGQFREFRDDAPFFDTETGYMFRKEWSLKDGEYVAVSVTRQEVKKPASTAASKPETVSGETSVAVSRDEKKVAGLEQISGDGKKSENTVQTAQVAVSESSATAPTVSSDSPAVVPPVISTEEQTVVLSPDAAESSTATQNGNAETLSVENPETSATDVPAKTLEMSEATALIERTRSLVGPVELSLSKKHFGDHLGDSELVLAIKKFQSENGLDDDGIIGSKTLKMLYLNAYPGKTLKDFSTLPIVPGRGFGETVRKPVIDAFLANPSDPIAAGNLRLMTYQELIGSYGEWGLAGNSGYRADTAYFHRDHVFNNPYFYGQVVRTKNVPFEKTGSGIVDTDINGTIPATVEEFLSLYPSMKNGVNPGEKNVSYMLRDMNGKFVTVDYRDGKLYFASFMTPGTGSTSPEGSTRVGGFKNLAHYFTNDDAKWRQFMEQTGGPMAYAVGTNRSGIYRHNGPTNGEKGSHGCFRLPTLYSMLNFQNPAKVLVFDPTAELK